MNGKFNFTEYTYTFMWTYVSNVNVRFILGFIKVGGYEAIVKKYFEAYPQHTIDHYGNDSDPYWKCGIPPDNSMNLIRSYDDGSLPWPGIMFGLTISSIWYWCSDQVGHVVQILLF